MRKLLSNKSNPTILYSALIVALSVMGIASYMSSPWIEQRIKPHKVYSFYYPWYGNPQVVGGSGIQTHWAGINVEKKIL